MRGQSVGKLTGRVRRVSSLDFFRKSAPASSPHKGPRNVLQLPIQTPTTTTTTESTLATAIPMGKNAISLENFKATFEMIEKPLSLFSQGEQNDSRSTLF
jgi:hypothetical protein